MIAAEREAPELRSRAPSSFFVAFRVLPRERRHAIETVYAFCRRADDAVDEIQDRRAARAALARIAEQLHAVFAGHEDAPETRALAQVVRQFALPRRPFELLLEGVGWDLEGRVYRTRAELREYCTRVASSVGTLCVRIFGCEDPRSERYAEELGVALQWTNILRDLKSDLARGRMYLPRESLARHALEVKDLLSGERGAEIAALVRSEAAYARACFAEAERLLPAPERMRVLAGSIMAAVYEALLTKIEREGAGVLERRVGLSAPRRAWIALGRVLRERARVRGGAGR